jgi:lipopolysaccharide transport system ATP-binding protein
VLAVGDAGFQKKCLGRMSDVARAGRTVLFVSHNLAAVESLCDRVIWLENGMVRADGHPGQVISGYLQTAFSPTTEQSWPDVASAPGNEVVRLRRACVRPVGMSPGDPITIRTPFVFEFDYWKAQPNIDLLLGFYLYNEQGVEVFSTWNKLASRHDVGAPAAPAFAQQPTPVGLYRDTCDVPGDLLNDGLHRVELWVASRDLEAVYWQDTVLVFEVRDSSDMRGGWFGKWTGAVRPALNWTSDLLAAGEWSDTLVASRQDGYNTGHRLATGSASLPAALVSSEPPLRPGVASSLTRMEG